MAESRRTLSLTASDVVKYIQGVNTNDAEAMKQAAMDLLQQVSLVWTSLGHVKECCVPGNADLPLPWFLAHDLAIVDGGKSGANLQNQKPMTSIQYKINARKALAGSPHLGSVLASSHSPSSIVPEQHGGGFNSAIATVTFGATAYTCTEDAGRIKLQVVCER